jgi:hypothetical protein
MHRAQFEIRRFIMDADDNAGFEPPSQRHTYKLPCLEPTGKRSGNLVREDTVAGGSNGGCGNVSKR